MNIGDFYRFGPTGDINIIISSECRKQIGALKGETCLILQLVCHAILQLKTADHKKESPRDSFIMEEHTWNNLWQLTCIEDADYYGYEYDSESKQMKEVPQHSSFTFAIYDLTYEGHLVFSLQEAMNGYVIQYVDLQGLDLIIESLIDKALEHAERFGRQGS